MTCAFVFPGQGSQAVGMGRDLAEAFSSARLVFEEVDDALSQRLSSLMFEGPLETLTLTENAQSALMASSLAVVRVLEEEGGFLLIEKCAFVAGHSLGEYSALAAAGSLGIAETARLLRRRGEAMQEAVAVDEGAMAAILGLSADAVADVVQEAADDQVCEVANDNAPGQVVVSGHSQAVERALDIARERGAKRSVRLTVSAPFHCKLMEPAAEAMDEALSRTTIAAPAVPLVANVTAAPVTEPATIRRHLVDQVTATVRWRESVLYLKSQDVDTLVELGTGTVLTGLARRIDRELAAVSVQSPAEVEAFLESL